MNTHTMLARPTFLDAKGWLLTQAQDQISLQPTKPAPTPTPTPTPSPTPTPAPQTQQVAVLPHAGQRLAHVGHSRSHAPQTRACWIAIAGISARGAPKGWQV